MIEDVKNKMTQLGDALYHYIEKVRLAAEQQRIAAASLEAERGAFPRPVPPARAYEVRCARLITHHCNCPLPGRWYADTVISGA